MDMIEVDVSAPRILIVEDEPALRQGVEAALRTGGYHTYSTEDGVEGLREGKRDCYSLIVLDLMLPGIDGFEICRRLREERVATPIIILTAKDSGALDLPPIDPGFKAMIHILEYKDDELVQLDLIKLLTNLGILELSVH